MPLKTPRVHSKPSPSTHAGEQTIVFEGLGKRVLGVVRGWLQTNRNILLIVTVTMSVHLLFALSVPFFSDESTYTYAAYTIGRGIVPYREVVLFHPPIGYMLLSLEVYLSGLSLFILRLLNIVVFSLDLFIVYKVFKKLEVVRGTALIAAGIFALLPTILNFRLGSPLEFLWFTCFLYSGLYLFIGHVTDSSRLPRLFAVGLFLGIASMTWLVGLFMIGTLAFIDLFGLRIAKRTFRDELVRLSSMAAGIVSVGLAVLAAVTLVWHALPQLLTQAVFYQSSVRTGLTFAQKLVLESETMPLLYLPLGLGVCGIVLSALKWKAVGYEKSLVPIMLISLPFLLVMFVPKNPFGQFFIFLVPLLSFFSASALANLDFQKARKMSIRLLVLYLVIAAGAVPATLSLWQAAGYSIGGYSRYNLAEEYVGSYVKNNTSSNDLIWTSEGGIAIFADRLIAPNNSTLWPYRAMYNDMFPCSYQGVLDVTEQGLNLDNSLEFIQGWNSSRVKVLVFIMGSGPIPYPDDILWNGCSQMPGVSGWVQAHFHRTQNFVFIDIPYDYSVWVRN